MLVVVVVVVIVVVVVVVVVEEGVAFALDFIFIMDGRVTKQASKC